MIPLDEDVIIPFLGIPILILKNILLSGFRFLGIGRVCYHALPDLRDCNSYDAAQQDRVKKSSSQARHVHDPIFEILNASIHLTQCSIETFTLYFVGEALFKVKRR